ncbi:MAG TPA: FKBP-type peptidyl-prolyl cis-trans isomerase [Candidatus Kaiserbacteria bacterium]|nr:FKBP-type peptidyl-prolyl cis-trans isomerase [Candidatus Kaiserbacteria bacterium]
MNNTSIATSIAVAIALIVVIISFFFGINIFSLFSSAPPSSARTETTSVPTTKTIVRKSSVVKKSSVTSETLPVIKKLSFTDTVVGSGAVAKDGDTVSVQYIGKLTDGKVFDSSAAHGDKPFSFVLGAGRVIKGWDEGLVGMKVGGTRLLAIPPALGYGNRAFGPIPANASLIFEVKLLNVVAPKK